MVEGRALWFASFALVAACSSSGRETATPADVGLDAGHDASSPYVPLQPVDGQDASATPIVTDGGPSFDAGSLGAQCASLEANVTSAATAAAACDPLLASQCGGTTPGLCCPVTISFGVDPSLTDDLNAAIGAFTSAGCALDCSIVPCPPSSPSGQCIGTGQTGTCE